MKNFREQIKHQLAQLITDNWLGSAPRHLYDPQVIELKWLDINRLCVLFKVNPDGEIDLEELKWLGISSLVIENLQKRRRIAQSILEGEEKELYEMNEHATSKIDLGDSDKE